MKAEYETKNKIYKRDEYGWYWLADLSQCGKNIGVIGNYYELNERLASPPEDYHDDL